MTLTRRQLEVLQLLADGLTAWQIGRRLGLTEKTVKSHLHGSQGFGGAYRRLGAANGPQAVAIAIREGLIH